MTGRHPSPGDQRAEASRGMPTPPPDLEAGLSLTDRQQAVLGELRTIILTEGFAHLTVGGMAERLQCSRRTLYEIAASRDDLVLVAIDGVLWRVARTAHAALRGEDDPLGRLRSFLQAGLVELHNATLAFSTDLANHREVHALVDRHFRYAASLTEALVEEGVETGVFRAVHARIVAEILDASIERLGEPDLLRVAGLTYAQALSEFLQVITDGLVSNPGSRPSGPSQRRAATKRARRSLPASSRSGLSTTS